MARNEHRKGALPYQFVPIPKLILASSEWQALSCSARVLALDLMGQYTGKNNGRLTPSYEVMRRCGWTSRSKLLRAKQALLKCSFAIRTRTGHPPSTAEWIAFTWWKLNYDDSMDPAIDPRDFPYLNFLSVESARIDPNQGRDKRQRKINSCSPETGPINTIFSHLSVPKRDRSQRRLLNV